MYKPKRKDDQMWFYGLAMIAALSVVVVGWRWLQDQKPAAERLGVRQVAVSRATGPIDVQMAALLPELANTGGILSVRSGRFEVFLVRLSETSFAAYGTRSQEGRALQVANGSIVVAGNPDVNFDLFTGRVLAQGSNDALRAYTVTATSSNVMVYQTQVAQPAAPTP